MNFDNLSIHEGRNCFAMIGEHFDRLSQAQSITYDISDWRKKNRAKVKSMVETGQKAYKGGQLIQLVRLHCFTVHCFRALQLEKRRQSKIT